MNIPRTAWSIVLALLLLAGLTALAFWWSLRQPEPSAPGQLRPLVIATNTEYLGACAVMAGQSQGYFARHGIAVQLQPYSTGKQALDAVLAGRADLATAADIVIMLAALDGKPLRILSTIHRAQRDHGVLARRGSGIVRPADLKGKRIGVTLRTSGHFTLAVYLNHQRLTVQDVQLVNYPPEAMLGAMQRREVDAVASWDPYLQAIATALGPDGMRFSAEDIYESIYNLVAQAAYVEQHKPLLDDLLRALVDGERFCREHPAEASAFIGGLSQEGRAAMLAGWSNNHFRLELEQDLLLALEDEARWAIQGGAARSREAPNFLDYIYMDGLQAVSPNDVSIIH